MKTNQYSTYHCHQFTQILIIIITFFIVIITAYVFIILTDIIIMDTTVHAASAN